MPLTENDVTPDLQVPVQPGPQLPPVMQVPEPKSLSQARSMARILFGPFSRIWVRVRKLAGANFADAVTYEVGTERNGAKKIYGIGEVLQEALQQAVIQVSALEHGRGLPRDVMPTFSRVRKPVLTRRQKWLLEYVDVSTTAKLISGGFALPPEDRDEIKALITHLRPNDVKDFQPPTIGTPEATQNYIERLREAVTRA